MKKVARIVAVALIAGGTVASTSLPASAMFKCGPCYGCCIAQK
jgi:hypothetical protein